jgi:hypothetical protein
MGKGGHPKKVKAESPVPDVHVSAAAAAAASKPDASTKKAGGNDDGSKFACPKCLRVFTSSYGLKYHTGKLLVTVEENMCYHYYHERLNQHLFYLCHLRKESMSKLPCNKIIGEKEETHQTISSEARK